MTFVDSIQGALNNIFITDFFVKKYAFNLYTQTLNFWLLFYRGIFYFIFISKCFWKNTKTSLPNSTDFPLIFCIFVHKFRNQLADLSKMVP